MMLLNQVEMGMYLYRYIIQIIFPESEKTRNALYWLYIYMDDTFIGIQDVCDGK